MIPFETDRLRIRGWTERDRPVFHRLNSDDTVMRFIPFRRDRAESDAMMDWLSAMLERDGITFFAVEAKSDGRVLGMTGLAKLPASMPFAPGVEIGWRLLPEEWGKGFATEAALGCLDRGFAEVPIDAVVSFCVADNFGSEAVMQRLAMQREADFDHPGVDPNTHPALVRHKLYRISRTQWQARKA